MLLLGRYRVYKEFKKEKRLACVATWVSLKEIFKILKNINYKTENIYTLSFTFIKTSLINASYCIEEIVTFLWRKSYLITFVVRGKSICKSPLRIFLTKLIFRKFVKWPKRKHEVSFLWRFLDQNKWNWS